MTKKQRQRNRTQGGKDFRENKERMEEENKKGDERRGKENKEEHQTQTKWERVTKK